MVHPGTVFKAIDVPIVEIKISERGTTVLVKSDEPHPSFIEEDTGIEWDVITELIIVNSYLETLPPLPVSLQKLVCSRCRLKVLPDLPATLTHIECQHNLLVEVPPLPEGLLEVWCHGNPISSLPRLGPSLRVLGCSMTKIVRLPAIPASLIELLCTLGSLETLPLLPETLKELSVTPNPFSKGINPDHIPARLQRYTRFEGEIRTYLDVERKAKEVVSRNFSRLMDDLSARPRR
jgi:hypothetical protein